MRNRTQVGTLNWTRATTGVLGARDRVSILGQAFLYALVTLPDELRRALGIRRRKLARVDLGQLAPPDSAVARAAQRIANDMAPAMIVNHSERTYLWGAILATHDGLRFDQEVVYVASLLHDIHFTDVNARPNPHCFTLPAAERAQEVGEKHGWNDERRDLAAEAITLHLNLRPPQNSPEAYVVYAGARLDTSGYRYGHIHPRVLQAVLDRHPRLNLKRDSRPMFMAQAAANPGTRVHFYTRYLGVNWFIARAPFEE